ncbi:MAG: transposase [FCB group bacterium]|nr:transposase [FCB group bacterium]
MSETPANENMSKLLRYHKNSDICFVTSVTYSRKPILVDNSDLLISALNKYQEILKYDLLAYVIMPDHIHLLIDCKGNNLSTIMQRIKLSFSRRYRDRLSIKSQRVWQPRFWDHIIRDQSDMNRHIDYIHFNPVKHALADSPFEWEFSTIHKFRQHGYYENRDWGKREKEFLGDYGE